jgi:hypothetical protein
MKPGRLHKFSQNFNSMEGLTNFWFKKDNANRTIFFPWGGFAKGRVIPDKTLEAKIRECVGSHWTSQFGLGIIGGTASTYSLYFLLIYIAVVVSLLTWYYFEIRKLVAGLPYSDTKMTFVESYANYTAEWSSFAVWLLFLFSILCFVGLSAVLVGDLWSGSKVGSTGWLVGIFFLLLLSGGAYIFGNVITLRARNRDQV